MYFTYCLYITCQNHYFPSASEISSKSNQLETDFKSTPKPTQRSPMLPLALALTATLAQADAVAAAANAVAYAAALSCNCTAVAFCFCPPLLLPILLCCAIYLILASYFSFAHNL